MQAPRLFSRESLRKTGVISEQEIISNFDPQITKKKLRLNFVLNRISSHRQIKEPVTARLEIVTVIVIHVTST